MTAHDTRQTRVRRLDDVIVVDLAGDINAGAEESMHRAWEQAEAAADGGPRVVALNFTDAGYINSTGIALVVGVLARARAQGIELRAFGLTTHYREIFDITRLADYIHIAIDEDSAIQGAEGSTT